MSALKPGLIVNARARGVLRDPGLADRLQRWLPAERVQYTERAEDVAAALEVLRDAGCDALVLVGGDGTMAGTLTPLLRVWPHDALPAIVPTAGGTVNTIARSLGARGTPESVVERLLGGEPPAGASERAVVEVRADDGDPVHGLIFVNGVGVRFLEMYYDDSAMGARGAASVVARIAASALVGGALARRIFAPFAARIRIDGGAVRDESWTAMGASSVRHVGLGFAPFLTAGEDPTRVDAVTTAAGALRIVRELPAIRMGRLAPNSAVERHSIRRLEIETPEPQPWTLDADIRGRARRLEVSAGPALRFLCP